MKGHLNSKAFLSNLTPEQKLLGGSVLIFGMGAMLIEGAEYWLPILKNGLRIPELLLSNKSDATIRIGSEKISDDSRLRHTHLVGATGSGKTNCLEHLCFADLKRGYGALIIDPKSDREFYDRVKEYCRTINREQDLCLLSATYPEESVVWNPCGLGGVSELQSKFFNSAIYNEPHYAKACEAALLRAFNTLTKEAPHGFNVTDLVSKLEETAKEAKDKNIEGLFLDLYNLAHGEWREILGCGENRAKNKKEITLLDVTQSNRILFVQLPTEAKAVQSARIGRLLTQEIMLISGMRKLYPDLKSKTPFSVFIDEFDAFATESIATFINKGRSSNFMIHLSHQTLSDLDKISPQFTGQIVANCNVRFVFRQDDPDDAERWAKLFGTKLTRKKTYQTENGLMTGAASVREVQEFQIHPDAIKKFKIGQCILSIKTESKLRELKVPAPLKLTTSANGADQIAMPRLTRGIGEGILLKAHSLVKNEAPIQEPTQIAISVAPASYSKFGTNQSHKEGESTK